MKTILVILLQISFFYSVTAQTYSFNFEGSVRSYLVHLPSGYSVLNRYPLVLNFHGLSSNAAEQQAYSRMNVTADLNKFIVVYPEGINKAWNAGAGLNSTVNDVGFVNALLDTLIKKYAVNITKVYSCGMSLGGYMTYRLGCALSSRFTALASVTGVLASGVSANCNPAKPLPLLHIHGTNDGVVAYGGSTGSLGAEASVKKWVVFDGCINKTDTTRIPNINTADQSTAELIKFSNCNNKLEVWFYKVLNGGHTWPGAVSLPNAVTNQDFNASTEIWKFFNRFPVISTGLDADPETENNHLYPNPVQNILFIPEKVFVSSVLISDITGKIIAEKSVQSNWINVSDLKQGFYYMQLTDANNKTETYRFLKN